MKKRRVNLQLSDRQQLILGLLLVILFAVSMLYCLGFASVAVRQIWQNAAPPLEATYSTEEGIEPLVTTIIEPIPTGIAPP